MFETVTVDTSLTIDLATTEVPTSGYWLVTPLNDLRVGAGAAILTRYRKDQSGPLHRPPRAVPLCENQPKDSNGVGP